MDEILDLLTSRGAVLEGHFLLTSGRHSSVYLEKFRLLEDPAVVDRLGLLLAETVSDTDVSVVLGAAVGGVLLSHAAARVLGTRAIFAERINGSLTLRRGFQLSASDAVFIVEDVVTTGGSVRELIDLAHSRRSTVVGVGCLVDRSAEGISFNVPTRALVNYPVESWDSDGCPLCGKGVKLVSRGSGAAS